MGLDKMIGVDTEYGSLFDLLLSGVPNNCASAGATILIHNTH